METDQVKAPKKRMPAPIKPGNHETVNKNKDEVEFPVKKAGAVRLQ